MNHAQRQLVWSGAIVAGLLALAGISNWAKPGLNCKDELEGYIDRRGRWVSVKSRTCE